MTKPTTEELKDLLKQVTQGPWLKSKSDTKPKHAAVYADGGLTGCAQVCIATKEFSADDANATLIALAPTLAAEVVRLRSALSDMLFEYGGRYDKDCLVKDNHVMAMIDRARQALEATSEK